MQSIFDLFVLPRFLGAAQCRALVEELAQSPAAPAPHGLYERMGFATYCEPVVRVVARA